MAGDEENCDGSAGGSDVGDDGEAESVMSMLSCNSLGTRTSAFEALRRTLDCADAQITEATTLMALGRERGDSNVSGVSIYAPIGSDEDRDYYGFDDMALVTGGRGKAEGERAERRERQVRYYFAKVQKVSVWGEGGVLCGEEALGSARNEHHG